MLYVQTLREAIRALATTDSMVMGNFVRKVNVTVKNTVQLLKNASHQQPTNVNANKDSLQLTTKVAKTLMNASIKKLVRKILHARTE